MPPANSDEPSLEKPPPPPLPSQHDPETPPFYLKKRFMIFVVVFVLSARFVPSFRTFIYTFFWTIIFSVAFLVYQSLTTTWKWRRLSEPTSNPLKSFKPLAFTAPRKLAAELEAVKREETFSKPPLYPASFVVSDALDDLLRLIVRDFINEWYEKISRDPIFSNQVDRTIRLSLNGIRERTDRMDLVEVAVGKVVPILTAHITDFSAAERAVRGKHLNKNLTESDELDLAIAAKYQDGKLHPAASLSFSDPKVAQQDYLRGVAEKILPLVLPPNEAKSRVVCVLTRELIACAVLYPLLTLLSDPDTWNQLMELMGKETLQDRKTVKKLRAALDQHATPDTPSKRLPFVRLGPNDDERTFERFIRSIRLCTNLSDARRLRNEIASQLKRAGQDHVYIRRLETGKRLLDQRVASLSSAGSDGARTPVFMSRSESSQSHGGTSRLEKATLIEILRNTHGLSYFMEYMDRQHRMTLVQFWMVVDGLRGPLEDDIEEGETSVPPGLAWTSSDRNDISQIYEAYLSKPELKIPLKSRDTVKQFLKTKSRATPLQYLQARGAILRAQTAVYNSMQEHDLANFKKSDLFYKYLAAEDIATASSTVAELPPPLPPRPEAQGKKGSISGRPTLEVLGDPLSPTTRHSFDDRRPSQAGLDDLFGEGSTSPRQRTSFDEPGRVETTAKSPDVVRAMEAAFNDIMGGVDDEKQQPSSLPSSTSRPPLFGDDTELFSDNSMRSSPDMSSSVDSILPPRRSSKRAPLHHSQSQKAQPSLKTLGLVNSFAPNRVFAGEALFPEDEGPFLEEDDNDLLNENRAAHSDSELNDVHEAAPGDLGLSEAIAELNFDIEKLNMQEDLVNGMLKKAELTNSAHELRTLRKTKDSLQREIRRKELQRQQYIIQESDSGLYGRATIKIDRLLVGRDDDGKDFAIYVVQVYRKAGDQMPAAEWAVARRYSEFFQLHQKLRERFPSIKNLEFPRRRVVMKLQRDFLEKRRAALEQYLSALIQNPEVCRSREFRVFLSQQSVAPAQLNGEQSPQQQPHTIEERQDFISKLYTSLADGVEDVITNLPVLEQLSQLSNAALPGLPFMSAVDNNNGNIKIKAPTANGEELNVAEAEAELSAYENKGFLPLVTPVCDMFLEVFELNKSGSWLRGRAVVVVIHQLLGGTIEKKLRDQFRALTDESSLLKYINLIKSSLWPDSNNGRFLTSRPVRTAREQSRSKKEASLMLATLMPDMAGNVVGRANAVAAGRRMFAVFNNRRLNGHVAFKVLDCLVEVLFPELGA